MSSLAEWTIRQMPGTYSKFTNSAEVLVGRDIEPREGLRVVLASRYAQDSWARDESGGRAGRIVQLCVDDGADPALKSRMRITGGMSAAASFRELKGTGMGKGYATRCVVLWDRSDGREWPKEFWGQVSENYLNVYKTGANGHYHLATDPQSPDPFMTAPSEPSLAMQLRKTRNEGVQASDAEIEEEEEHNGPDFQKIEGHRLDLEGKLADLRGKVLNQLEDVMIMCEECLSDVEFALAPDPDPKMLQPKQEKKAEAKAETKKPEEEVSEEEKKLGDEIETVWKYIDKAERAFKRKIEADEYARLMLDELKEFVYPAYLSFFVVDLPDVARKLERIADAGIPQGPFMNKLPGPYPEQLAAGIEDRLRYSQFSWGTAATMLVPDPALDPADQETELANVKGELSTMAKQLQAWKYRDPNQEFDPEKLPWFMGQTGKKTVPELFQRRSQMIDKFMRDDGGTVPLDEMVTNLEAIAKRPEAVACTAELTELATLLKNTSAAFKEVLKWEDGLKDPKKQVPAEKAKAGAEREAAFLKILTAFNRTPPPPIPQRSGPEYDPEDKLGAVFLGNELEEEQLRCRQVLQAMMMRAKELQKQREALAQKNKQLTDSKETSTDFEEMELLKRLGVKDWNSIGGDMVGDLRRLKDKWQVPKLNASLAKSSDYAGFVRMLQNGAEGDNEAITEADLPSARASLNAAHRYFKKVDMLGSQEQLQALGEHDPEQLVETRERLKTRSQDLAQKLLDFDQKVTGMEEFTLYQARAAIARANLDEIGPLRGEFVGDVNAADQHLQRARIAYEKSAHSMQLREEDLLRRERDAATRHQLNAYEQAERLLEEGHRLAAFCDKKLSDMQPLEALLLFRSAEAKFRRSLNPGWHDSDALLRG